MPLLLTNYIFMNNILKKLDINYETKLREKTNTGDILFKSDKIFIYSNTLTFLRMYDNNKYSIPERLQMKSSYQSFISFSIDYIKKSNYNKEHILYALSLLSITILEDNLNSYFREISKLNIEQLKNYLDYIYSKKYFDIDLKTLDFKTYFDKGLLLELRDYDFLKDSLSFSVKFPLADKMLELSINKFKKKKFKYNKKIKIDEDFLDRQYNKKSFLNILEISFNKAYDECEKFLNDVLFK